MDASEEMLAQARRKQGDRDILFLQQEMTDFELYGTVDAVVCLLDSVNYVLEYEDLLKCFKWVNNYLNPGGVFVFDINTAHKLENVLAGNIFNDEHDNIFYSWENYFDSDEKICEFDINFFVNGYDDDDDNLLIKKVSKETLKLIPERNLIALVALGIDGEEYCKAIEKAMEETGAGFSGEEKMIYNMVKQILRKTDGTLAAAVAGKNFDSDPDFLFIMPTPFSEIKPMLDIFGDEIPKDVYVDGDKKAFSVTNIRTYTYGDAKPSFEKAGNATSSYVYAYVDAEPIVDAYFTERTRRTIPEEARFLNTWRRLADLFDFAQLKVEKRDEATIEFVLNEDSKNSLSLFLEQGIKIGVACVEYDKVRAQRYNYDYLLDEDYYDVEVVEAEEPAPAEQGE